MIELLRDRYRRHAALVQDARAATELSRLGLAYTPWTASALRPAAVALLVNEVLINRRRTVVEFGAGISTLHLAKALAGTGGQLISIEDDPGWAEVVGELLSQHGLDDAVRIVVAPLAPCRHACDGLGWYAGPIITAALAGLSIDMVVVDGPKAFEPGKALARYPAWLAVRDHLAPACLLALDDFERAGEQAVLALWQALPGFDLAVTASHTGLALCSRGPAFHTAM